MDNDYREKSIEFVKQAMEGDFVAAKESFQTMISGKSLERLEDRKIDMASNMFSSNNEINEIFGRKGGKRRSALKVKSTEMNAYYPVTITTESSEQAKKVASAVSKVDHIGEIKTSGNTVTLHVKGKGPESAEYIVNNRLKESAVVVNESTIFVNEKAI